MSKIKILIADKQALICEGIKNILLKKNDLAVIGVAKNSTELREMLLVKCPDLVIIDIHLPGYFSLQDIVFIRENFPFIKVLVLTNNNIKKDILNVLNQGVNSYLLKECEEAEILNAVYSAANNEKFFCGKIMEVILEKANHHCPIGSVCRSCRTVQLSEREIEIIKLIAESHTTTQIAVKLFLSFHTISTHRKNIFKKLKIRSSSELIIYALKNGIINPA